MPRKSNAMQVCIVGMLSTIVGMKSDAQEASSEFAIGVGVSTIGVTLEGTYQLSPRLRLRGLYAQSPDLAFSDDVGGIPYEFSWDGYGLALLADYRFPNSPFLITAGVLYSEHRIIGRASGTFTVNNEAYTTDLEAIAEFDFRWLPVVALGLEYPIRGGVLLTGEAGIAYSGGVEARLTAIGGSVSSDDIIAETADFEDDFLEFYPFINIGLKLRF